MNVEGVPEILARHRRALQVPARTPEAVWRGPGRARRLTGLRALPQGKVARVVLASGVCILGRRHVLEPLVGQLAIRGPGADIEIHVCGAIGGGIGMPLLDQHPHQLDHLRDVAGGTRLIGRRQHAQGLERRARQPLVAIGQGEPVLAAGCGLGEDLVVDIGDIAHQRHGIPMPAHQPAPQDVEGDGEADVSDVRRSLRGQATDIDADLAWRHGHEVTQLTVGGIEKAQAHSPRLPGPCEGPDPTAHPGCAYFVPADAQLASGRTCSPDPHRALTAAC